MAKPKAPKTRMQKSGKGHTYYLDGEYCPGVTSIIGDGVPKNGLIGWASKIPADVVANALQVTKNSEGKTRIVADDLIAELRDFHATLHGRDHVPWSDHTPLPRAAVAEALANLRYRDLDAAAHKGTQVHRLAERIGRGEEVEIPEELVGHVGSYLKFLNDWQPYDAVLEGIIVNRQWRYMGKFDCLAAFDNLPDWLAEKIGNRHGVGLLDIKTSRSGIFAETALQLEAYRRGETMLEGAGEVPMPAVDFVAAIHVRADGYDVYGFDINTTTRPTTFDIFLYAKQVGEWLNWKDGPASRVKSDSLHPPKQPATNPEGSPQ